MCGIAGVFSYREDAPPVDRDELTRAREAMAYRGPDGAGLWISRDQRVGLAHRRLAIIDLSDNGLQPMAGEDGALQIVFNGEIYNYRELRAELQSRGRVFRSDSDTEVLLHLYAERGEDMVHALRGMFAFAIWDSRRQELLLARDPLGIKPLYYADDGRTMRFSTLVQALVAGGGVDTAEDVAGVAGFYLWGCVPEPHTFYRGVRALPAGHLLRAGRGGSAAPRAYFSVAEVFREAEANPVTLPDAQLHARVGEVMRESMRHHMVADVPVSLFLSAGVDSNVLASLGASLSPERLHGITLGFDEYRGTPEDETELAAASAAGLAIGHQTQWLRRADFAEHRPGFAQAMDQASTDGINSYLVARAARKSGFKLAISGLGGDELFGGYPSFRDVPRMRRLIPGLPGMGRALRGLSAPLLRAFTSPKYASLLEYGGSLCGAYLLRRALYLPWELPGLLGRDRAHAALELLRPLDRLQESVRGLRNERCMVATLELSWYMRNQLLRDADWAGMYHGVEIRVPFVDAHVLRALAPLMAGANPPGKTHLVNAIAHPLTADLLQRRKTGFSVPVADWLRAEFPRLKRERGLRGWARVVGRLKSGSRYLALLTDAYGGHGGIALHNRDLLQSICDMPDCAQVVAVPRLMPNPPEAMPAKLRYLTGAVGGKLRYLAQTARMLRGDHAFDLVICGHINLVPLAWLVSRWLGVPAVLFIHGIDAWQPTGSRLVNRLVRRIPWVVAVSELTAGRFRNWVHAPRQTVLVNPNGIHLDWYGPGPKDEILLERYGLNGKRVLMTLGRLVSAERYKGFDEVLDVLPRLLEASPDLAYLIVGDGSDRGRLQAKVASLGLQDHVVFTGLIPEHQKADHYRIADVFVMASRGEGFGFVLLEALACGVPVIASKLDGGREAVRGGMLGALVDPGNHEELRQAIARCLDSDGREVPPGLSYYSFPEFAARSQALIRRLSSNAFEQPAREVESA